MKYLMMPFLGGALTIASAGVPAAQVFVTDVVVQGSECVGFDCVNGESFGSDTLRLKENNLRIHFNDTSNSGSFPTRDWRIVINDTTNGGASYFAIEDSDAGTRPFTVEAGAGANALVVDSNRRIGIRTATPATDLHVVSGNTPALRLDQDGSSGFTAQAWDVAGNETNFFVRDVTNSSNLPFRIVPGAQSSSILINRNGSVVFGLGTTSVPSSDGVDIRTTLTSQDAKGSNAVRLGVNVSPRIVLEHDRTVYQLDNYLGSFRIFQKGAVRMTLGADGHLGLNRGAGAHAIVVGTDATNGNGAYLSVGGVWTNGSSRDSKTGVEALSSRQAREALMALAPVNFQYTGEPGEQYVGFIAEDVPELVATADRKHLSPMDIVAVVTKVVQDQQREIEALREQLARLEGVR